MAYQKIDQFFWDGHGVTGACWSFRKSMTGARALPNVVANSDTPPTGYEGAITSDKGLVLLARIARGA